MQNNNSKINTILLIILIILALGVIWIQWHDRKAEERKDLNNLIGLNEAVQQAQDYDVAEWKTYTNTKYGFSFQYPSTWSQWGKEGEAICDIHTGATCVFNIDFVDTFSQGIERYDENNNQIAATKDFLHVEYHYDSKGTTLYQLALDQFESKEGMYANASKIEVAGRTAIMTDTIISTDGKGNPIIPFHNIIVEFLDKNQVGEFRFVFQTPVSESDNEILIFQQLLQTFQFK